MDDSGFGAGNLLVEELIRDRDLLKKLFQRNATASYEIDSKERELEKCEEEAEIRRNRLARRNRQVQDLPEEGNDSGYVPEDYALDGPFQRDAEQLGMLYARMESIRLNIRQNKQRIREVSDELDVLSHRAERREGDDVPRVRKMNRQLLREIQALYNQIRVDRLDLSDD